MNHKYYPGDVVKFVDSGDYEKVYYYGEVVAQPTRENQFYKLVNGNLIFYCFEEKILYKLIKQNQEGG